MTKRNTIVGMLLFLLIIIVLNNLNQPDKIETLDVSAIIVTTTSTIGDYKVIPTTLKLQTTSTTTSVVEPISTTIIKGRGGVATPTCVRSDVRRKKTTTTSTTTTTMFAVPEFPWLK